MLYGVLIFGSAITGLVIAVKDGWGIVDKVVMSLLGTTVGLVLGGLLAVTLLNISHLFFTTEFAHVGNKEIHALQDNQGVSGRFFLGSGQVDSELKYYFIVKGEKGMYAETVDVKGSYINESDDVVPNVDYYKQRFKNDIVQWLTPAWPSEEHVFEIPKDSIVQDYKIDLR